MKKQVVLRLSGANLIIAVLIYARLVGGVLDTAGVNVKVNTMARPKDEDLGDDFSTFCAWPTRTWTA